MNDLIERSYHLMGFFVRTKRFINQQRLRPQQEFGMNVYPEFLKRVQDFGRVMHQHKELVERSYVEKSEDLEQKALKSLIVLVNKKEAILAMGVLKE